jgi:hypothetical protein
MALFTAYFDESGTPQVSKFLLITGYIGRVRDWRIFDQRWNAILAKYGVENFHMKDCAHFRGEFEPWKGKEAKRKRFLRDLTNQIILCALCSFNAVLDLDAWRALNEKYPLDDPTVKFGPYALCGQMCVQLVELWCQERHRGLEDVKFVFEDGAYQKGMLIDRLSGLYDLTPSFEKRRAVSALQAADFSAYEYGKAAPNLAQGFFSDTPRIPFIRLNTKIKSNKTLLWRRRHIETFALHSQMRPRA